MNGPLRRGFFTETVAKGYAEQKDEKRTSV